MERAIYRKGNLERVALTPGERVRLEHAGWRHHPDPPPVTVPAETTPVLPSAEPQADPVAVAESSSPAAVSARRRKTL